MVISDALACLYSQAYQARLSFGRFTSTSLEPKSPLSRNHCRSCLYEPLRRLYSWTGSRFLSTSPCPGYRLKSSACLSLLTGAFASVEDGETEHLPHETNRHPYRDAKNFYVVKAPRRTQLAVENQSPKYPLTSIRQTTWVAACQGASADC